MDLTQNEIKVIDYLRGKTIFTEATVIGRGAGGLEYGCGTWAGEVCTNLVRKGLMERSSNGWYRLCRGHTGK